MCEVGYGRQKLPNVLHFRHCIIIFSYYKRIVFTGRLHVLESVRSDEAEQRMNAV